MIRKRTLLLTWLAAMALVCWLPSCRDGATGAEQKAETAPEQGGEAQAAEAEAELADWPPLEEGEGSSGIVELAMQKLPPTLILSDAMIQPGETAQISIKLGRGLGSTTIKTYGGYRVVVTDADGKEVLSERTDENGLLMFERKFEKVGNYFYRAAVDKQVENKDVTPALIGVYVRKADVPIAICDLDKTLVKSSFFSVLAGMAEAFDHSTNVLHRLVDERKMTIVYLTHRPDFLAASSKHWVRTKGFPPGPLFTSDIGGLFTGSGKFKTAEIARLKERFGNIRLAVGDKYSDSNAYVANDIHSILIPDIDWEKDKPGYWQEQLAEMKSVDSKVTVCRDWFEIEDAIFKDKEFPPSRMLERIREQARQFGVRD